MTTPLLDHSDRVAAALEDYAAGQSGRERAGRERDIIRRSWVRSAGAHGLDPADNTAPHILTAEELRPLQEQVAQLVEYARDELDRLYNIVRHLRYVVLLANHDSVIVDHRGDQRRNLRYRYWGSWLGGVWAEAVEGANGIGTCIAEGRAVTIHKTEHFRARHTSLSCVGAPIYAATGEILGVLCVSREDPQSGDFAHELVDALVAAAARAIEERLFRAQHRNAWIVAARADAHGVLLAVDRDRRIVASDPHARSVLASLGGFVATGLWDLFEHDKELFRHKDGDKAVHLIPKDSVAQKVNGAWPAVVTPPVDGSAGCKAPDMRGFLLRPRLDLLVAGRLPAPAPALRGGLPPMIMRRLRTYVDTRIDQTIDLKALAAEARLSAYHFARAFKQSEGITPHRFILQRRLAKARELLEQDRISLAEIASAVGFADQSHFTRRFRDQEGVSPGEFRRLRQQAAGAPTTKGV